MSLATIPRPLPTSAIATGGMALRRLVVARAIPVARRTYWSFRCAKPGRTWAYQYWGAASPARCRHWRTGSSADAVKETGEQEDGATSAGVKGDKTVNAQANDSGMDKTGASKTHTGSSTSATGENNVQSDEQRFLNDEWSAWEKAARAHAEARLEFLRRALEKDPYEVMFGGREARGLWNPWRYRDGFWRWPSLWERWGRRSKGMAEYLEARSQEMATVFEDAKKELEQDGKIGETTVKEEDGVKTASKRDIKVEEKDGRTVETTTETSRSTTIPSVQSGDVYIDLITLRKVQRVTAETPEPESSSRTPPPPAQEPPSAPKGTPGVPVKGNDAHQIPIKKFSKSDSLPQQNEDLSSTTDKPLSNLAKPQEWLRREGFATDEDSTPLTSRPGPRRHSPSPTPKAVHTPPVIHASAGYTLPVPRNQSTQIQNVLDRWPPRKSPDQTAEPKPKGMSQSEQDQPPSKAPSSSLKDRLVYEPKDNTQDDVDLLRASDIRAVSGKVNQNSSKLTAAEMSARRNALTREFAESQHRFEVALRKEIIEALKNNNSPTKSPLWGLWMLYDQAGRQDWEKWERKKHFTRKGENELKEMQYMSQAFLEQMPSPPEIFASGGSSLSRYLDANRVSMALSSVQRALNRWHMEMQSLLVRRGVKPFSDDVLDNVRRALVKYHMELRRQILSGKGPEVIRTTDPEVEKRHAAADAMLAREVASQRTAMERHEQRPRNTGNQSGGKGTFIPWTPPGGQQSAADIATAVTKADRDSKLSRELRDIYEAEYGKITTRHRQPKGEEEVEGQPIVWDETPEVLEIPLKPSDVATEPESTVTTPAADVSKLPSEFVEETAKTSSSLASSPPPPEPAIPGKNETYTVLLTLAHRTGAITLHPPSIWPILQARLPADVSPLESSALCTFLSSAANPQRVLREVVNLQAKGYRLVSGRKGCLVFQQPAPIQSMKRGTQANEEDAGVAISEPMAAADVKAPSTESTLFAPESSNFKPIPSVTSTGASSLPVSSTMSTPPSTQQTPEPTLRAPPDPSQHVRRMEPHFVGQPVAASLSTGAGKPFPEGPPNSSTAPHSTTQSGSPPPPPNSFRRHRHRHHPRWHHPRRRPLRRFLRSLFRVLVSALLVAWGAYSVGILMEWMAKRKALREMLERERVLMREGYHGAHGPAVKMAEHEDCGKTELVPDAMRRWFGRVWWLGEGDTVGKTEWEESRKRYEEERARNRARIHAEISELE